MNETWDEGYNSNHTYTYGYYNQLNPLQFQLNFLAQGKDFPKIKTACELGFGQGISINMHAVSSDIEWYGNDFMPDQVAFAKKFAQNIGPNIHLYDDSFYEFLNRDDLPNFDYIAIHGILSWISDENKQYIVDFVKRKLNVGGILYISYNTLPGFSKAQQIREMMSVFTKHCQSPNLKQDIAVDNALNFTEKLFKVCPDLVSYNPRVFDTINDLKKLDHTYLAQEYLNQNWDPMYFHQFAKMIEPAKVNYVCSAMVANLMDLVNFNDEHREIFETINNPTLKETMKDMIENRQFRCDLWSKGTSSLTPAEQEQKAKDLSFIFVSERENVALSYQGRVASVDLSKILNPILDLISDFKVHKLSEILKATAKLGFNFKDTMFALESLAAQNAIFVAQDINKSIKENAAKLNKFILNSSFMDSKIQTLAAPVMGGAINFNTLDQLFFLAYNEYGDKISVDQIMDFIGKRISIDKVQLSRNGVTLGTPDENKALIMEEANKFIKSKITLYKNLGVI